LACKGTIIVTVLKATSKFTSGCSRFISIPVASTVLSFVVAICISAWMTSRISDYKGLRNKVAVVVYRSLSLGRKE
jgi:hypothetical protein